ncbi:hypothetical protein LTS10_007596 [Elasticomyces elasticus]|nr:hypothetical protein LTS10_007596 [Elasticomyces elasticus]
MADRTELYKQYSILSIPIWYLQKAYGVWQGPGPQLATTAVGTAATLLIVYKLASVAWDLIRPSTLQRYCHVKTGSWALVTGATDGIGKAYADELLNRGFNVLLHGRNPEKLERVKQELGTKYPRRSIDVVVADASRTDYPERTVVEKVKKLPGKLVILINNVGGVNTTPMYQSHEETTTANIDTIFNINARFPIHLTSALMPFLRESKPALILNCGSGAGAFGVPYLVTYSGTKAFIEGFSRSLAAELMCEGLDKDIEVKCFTILNTRSAGNTGEMVFFTIDAIELARASLNKIGSPHVVLFGHWRHALQGYMMGSLPENYLRKVMVPEMRGRKAAEEAAAAKKE